MDAVKPEHVDVAHIPEKVYFRIGEVSNIVEVDPHVLRYWESEFDAIRPVRGKSRQRLYRRRDVIVLLYIRDLLHRQGYTISGAKKRVHQFLLNPQQEGVPPDDGSQRAQSSPMPILAEIKLELTTLLGLLQRERR